LVSLQLTGDQIQVLRDNPCAAALLESPASTVDEASRRRREGVIIHLELPATPPLRLLKTDEVLSMLRISKSCLRRIIRQGRLRSYRLGQNRRLRRIPLEDVLTYLEEGREMPCTEPRHREGRTSSLSAEN
jgi:excisionase family DNA binding protein